MTATVDCSPLATKVDALRSCAGRQDQVLTGTNREEKQ
jgi:hypothetical protein